MNNFRESYLLNLKLLPKKLLTLNVLILMLLMCSFTINAAQDPLHQTQSLIAALKNVKENDKKTYLKVDQYIDYDYMTTRSIAPHADYFSKQKSDQFRQLFQSLIRMVAYPQSSSFYNDAKSVLSTPVIIADTAQVKSETSIAKDDFEMEIIYQWKKSGGNWLLSDLLIDEDSLIKDYQNQFGRILKKDGVDVLMQKINDKINDIEKENEK